MPDCISRPFSSSHVQRPSTVADTHSRRLGLRLGCILGKSCNLRSLDVPLDLSIHQRKGTSGDIPRASSLESRPFQPGSYGFYGQCSGSIDNQEEGISKIPLLVEDTNQNREIMRSSPDQTSSEARVRRSECGGGCPIQIEPQTIGVDTSPREVPGNLLVVGSSASGSLRNPSQCQDQGVCVSSTISGTSGLLVSALGPVVPPLCVSTQQTSSQVSLSCSSSEAPSVSNNRISLVAEEGMVPIADVPGPPRSQSPQSPSSPPLTGSTRDDSVSPQPSDFKLARSALIRRELERLHWSSPAISVIGQSLRPQSSSVYDRHWAEFTSFARHQVSSLSEVSLATLMGFLHHLAFGRKLQISTIKIICFCN